MAHYKHQPPAPKERPLSLAVTGTPAFEGPRQTKGARNDRADTIGLTVFMVLIVLGLIAAGRAFLVM